MTDQPKRRTYTSEEFEQLLGEFRSTRTEPWTDRSLIMMAALRIAANVMRPGEIESVVNRKIAPRHRFDISYAIRAALTKDDV